MTKQSIKVVFCDKPVKHFSHVYCIVWGFAEPVVIDMTYGRLTVSYDGFPPPEGWTTVTTEVAPNTAENRIWWPLMPLSCVSFTKRLLGINKPFILTSRQLYSYLRGKEHGITILAKGSSLTPTAATAPDTGRPRHRGEEGEAEGG